MTVQKAVTKYFGVTALFETPSILTNYAACSPVLTKVKLSTSWLARSNKLCLAVSPTK